MRIFRMFTDGNQTLKQGDEEIYVRGSVHHNINYIEMTNEMQLFTRIYYSSVY
jgi:3-methyladenine DNA glycosylase AlkC